MKQLKVLRNNETHLQDLFEQIEERRVLGNNTFKEICLADTNGLKLVLTLNYELDQSYLHEYYFDEYTEDRIDANSLNNDEIEEYLKTGEWFEAGHYRENYLFKYKKDTIDKEYSKNVIQSVLEGYFYEVNIILELVDKNDESFLIDQCVYEFDGNSDNDNMVNEFFFGNGIETIQECLEKVSNQVIEFKTNSIDLNDLKVKGA